MDNKHDQAPALWGADPRRTSVALIQLLEAGDQRGAATLIRMLSGHELRSVLLQQTANATLVFESVFDRVRESVLPGIAERSGRSRAEVTSTYLQGIVLGLAADEVGEP